MSEPGKKVEFVEPASVQEARERRERLNQEIRDIEVQLSNKDVKVDERRTSGLEYHQWRTRPFTLSTANVERAYGLGTGYVCIVTPPPL